ISEENYFFKLSNYQDRLLDLYKTQPQFVQPDFRRNEVVSFVESGLKDVSISRKTIKWGIPWPDDPEHVFYVWYDALTSYMSGIGYASDDVGQQEKFKAFWPAQLHMIGKEIIRFHAVYWPAFLMAADLPLPKQIFAHGWLLFEQEKMSKSKGNVAYAEPIVKTLGNDALRYYLLREVVFGQDGNFSREALITRYNADLANGLGNLASRTLTMIERSFQGAIPPIEGAPESIAIAGVLAHPVIPEATQKIWQQLGQSGKLEDVRIDQLEWGGLKPGTKIAKIEAVFPRADKKENLEKIETMETELRNPGSSAAEPKPSAPPTTEADVPTPSGAGAAAAAAAPAVS